MDVTAKDIAIQIDGELEGDGTLSISNIKPIEEADETSLAFLAQSKYHKKLLNTRAGALLINKTYKGSIPGNKTIIKVPNVYAALATILNQFYPNSNFQNKSGISSNASISQKASLGENNYIGAFACIEDHAEIGDNVKIFPGSYIGDGTIIGSNTVIYPGVKIYADSKIGNNCILHSGTVIGSDGFGFAPLSDGTYKKIPQTGNVIIEDDVEIGANCTIDKATLSSTLIEEGAKLDNLIQIGHNVKIGKRTVIVAQSGISGSSTIGEYSQIGGQVGIVGHISIAEKSQIGAKSGIAKDIRTPGQQWFGIPAEKGKEAFKLHQNTKKIPDLEQKVSELQQQLKELQKELESYQKKEPESVIKNHSGNKNYS